MKRALALFPMVLLIVLMAGCNAPKDATPAREPVRIPLLY